MAAAVASQLRLTALHFCAGLINNSGLQTPPDGVTEDGFEVGAAGRGAVPQVRCNEQFCRQPALAYLGWEAMQHSWCQYRSSMWVGA